MKLQKNVILPAVALALAVSVWGTASIYAQEPADTNPHDTLIKKLVSKFNLKESDVKAVFDEVHTERHAAMEKRFEERLSQAVLDGKINATQKAAILKKHEELENQREAERNTWKNMSTAERRAAMEKKKSEMEAWAKANGLENLQNLFGFGMGKGGFHRGMSR